jgi:hypothetical protein
MFSVLAVYYSDPEEEEEEEKSRKKHTEPSLHSTTDSSQTPTDSHFSSCGVL